MFPYKIVRVQQVKPHGFLSGSSLPLGACKSTIGPQFFLRRIVFSDEYVFHVSGIANNKNVGFWGSENPRLAQESQLQSAEKLYGALFTRKGT